MSTPCIPYLTTFKHRNLGQQLSVLIMYIQQGDTLLHPLAFEWAIEMTGRLLSWASPLANLLLAHHLSLSLNTLTRTAEQLTREIERMRKKRQEMPKEKCTVTSLTRRLCVHRCSPLSSLTARPSKVSWFSASDFVCPLNFSSTPLCHLTPAQ